MDTLSYKTVSVNKTTAQKEWILIDAEGKTLGRLATEIAMYLRGKKKPSFTPNVDCGDNVVVINAEKVKLSGKKWDEKVYLRYSGYPGGLKSRTATEMKAKFPTRLVENAVKGMLPKGRLGRDLYRNLYVYAGVEHKHEAQQPKKIEL